MASVLSKGSAKVGKFGQIADFAVIPDMISNVREITARMVISEQLIEDSAIPKKELIEILTQDFKKKLREYFGDEYPDEYYDTSTKPKLDSFCGHCAEPIEEDEDCTLIVNTQEKDTIHTMIKRWLPGHILKYGDNVICFHRECFISIAGDMYEYVYKPPCKKY